MEGYKMVESAVLINPDKSKVRLRRRSKYYPTTRNGSNGYDDPGVKLEKRNKRRGPSDTWLAHKYMGPIYDDSLFHYKHNLESRTQTRETISKPIVQDEHISRLNDAHSLAALCDPKTMPRFAQRIINSSEGYMNLLIASVRAPWIHYQGTLNEGIFWMDLPQNLELSPMAVDYFIESYDIDPLDKDPENTKKVLLLAGLDLKLIPKRKGNKAYVFTIDEDNKVFYSSNVDNIIKQIGTDELFSISGRNEFAQLSVGPNNIHFSVRPHSDVRINDKSTRRYLNQIGCEGYLKAAPTSKEKVLLYLVASLDPQLRIRDQNGVAVIEMVSY